MAIGFYQNDVLKAVGSFFTSSKLLSEFRPISCCNIAYKYITKILANRLKLCLADVIGPTKSTFILGRSIAENIISCLAACGIPNKFLHWVEVCITSLKFSIEFNGSLVDISEVRA